MLGREPTPIQIARLKLLENRKWFDQHLEEIQKEYGGKFIVVHNNKILASGSTIDEINSIIDQGKYPEDEVLRILVPSHKIEMIVLPEVKSV